MEGEVVELAPSVRVTEQIESWLTDLTRAMKNTLQQQTEVLCAGRMQDEFKAAASQCLQLKEAIAFTEKWVGVMGVGWGVTGACAQWRCCGGGRGSGGLGWQAHTLPLMCDLKLGGACPAPNAPRPLRWLACRAEVAIKGGSSGLAKFVADMRQQLTKLTQSDFTGHNLLQLKKQALVGGWPGSWAPDLPSGVVAAAAPAAALDCVGVWGAFLRFPPLQRACTCLLHWHTLVRLSPGIPPLAPPGLHPAFPRPATARPHPIRLPHLCVIMRHAAGA